MSQDAPSIRGLTTLKYAYHKVLQVQPSIATYPMRCLFTNEPVTELTEMSVREIRPRHGVQGLQEPLKIKLPISPDWLQRQIRSRKLVPRILWYSGLLGVAFAFVAAWIPESLLAKEQRNQLIGTAIGTSIWGLLIGGLWPFLKDLNSDPRSVQGIVDADKITIQGVHPDFLAQLPEVVAGRETRA